MLALDMNILEVFNEIQEIMFYSGDAINEIGEEGDKIC